MFGKKKKKYWNVFKIGMLVILGQQVCGSNPVYMLFNMFINNSVHGNQNALVFYSTLMGIISFIITLITSLITEMFGRKTLLVSGMLLMFLADISYSSISYIQADSQALISIMLLWTAFYRFSVGTLSFTYAAEVLPSVGVSFAVFVTWVLGFITVEIFVPIINVINIEGIMLIYGAACFILAVVYIKCLVESKGKTKAELLSLYLLSNADTAEYKEVV